MDNLREQLHYFLFERDGDLLYEIGAVAVGYGICKVAYIILKNTVFHPIPTFPYPQTRDENFKVIKNALEEGTLPKIFRPHFFPGSTFRKQVRKLLFGGCFSA